NGVNHLRDALAQDLKETITLELSIQLGLQQDDFPLDDATVVWDERKSPFIRIATIELAAQRFVHGSRYSFAERIEYNPFHALAAHRPLGSINFARGTAYAASQFFRKKANNAPSLRYKRA